MGACSIPGVSTLCSAVGGVTSDVAGDFVKTAATDAANAADSLLKTLATSWTGIATPNLGDGSGNGAATQLLQGDLKFVTLWVGVASLLVAAGRMAYMRRADPLREAAMGLIRLLLVGGMGIVAIDTFASIGDQFSSYVLSSATSSQAGGLNQATSLFKLTGAAGFSAVPFLLLILALLAVLSTLVQLFLIIIRGALLVLIGGTWPLAAAASMTSGGSQWFKKVTGYLVAFLLYKPAAAICYAAAFKLIASAGPDPVIAQIEGVVLIIMATLTLPALLKFVVPAVSSAGGFGAGEALAAGAAVATGAAAIIATGGGSAAAGAGASGAAGVGVPAGATTAGPGGAGGPPGASPPGGDGFGGGGPPGVPGPDGGDSSGNSSSSENDLVSASVGGSGGGNGPGGSDATAASSGAFGGNGSSGSNASPGASASSGGGRAAAVRDAGRSFADAASRSSGALGNTMGDEDE
jgi:type IV secretion system protein TrbL